MSVKSKYTTKKHILKGHQELRNDSNIISRGLLPRIIIWGNEL